MTRLHASLRALAAVALVAVVAACGVPLDASDRPVGGDRIALVPEDTALPETTVSTTVPRSSAVSTTAAPTYVVDMYWVQGDRLARVPIRFATEPDILTMLTVLRAGKETTLSVALQVAPEGERDELTIKTRSPFQGATVVNIGPALAERLRLEPDTEGVAVTEVPDGSAAAQYGFQQGDIIVAVNGTKISRTRDLERATRDPSRIWRITIQRGGQQISAVFSG